MNKMIVAVFDTEPAAFEGLSALKDLDKDGDISLYAAAVVVKDNSGNIVVKQEADEGPIGTGVGMLTGAVVGLLAGPIGMAVGASVGGLTGMIFDLNKTGIDISFLDDVSKALTAGKVAVLADVEESWTTPVDTRLQQAGGLVFRRLRAEVVEDQLAREAVAFDSELKELKDELAQASGEVKTAIQKKIDSAEEKLQATENLAKARLEHTKSEVDAKITALQAQMKGASDRNKSKIEKRIADTKADFASRSAKLQQAAKLAKEALSR
jgi:uncharacterized membrane protein